MQSFKLPAIVINHRGKAADSAQKERLHFDGTALLIDLEPDQAEEQPRRGRPPKDKETAAD